MTPEEILSGIKLIAEFMGGVKINDSSLLDDDLKRSYWKFPNNVIEPADKLSYHKSWNAIMPVWVKFRDLDTDLPEHDEWVNSLQYYLFSCSGSPERFFERLTYAIKWYNENKIRDSVS